MLSNPLKELHEQGLEDLENLLGEPHFTAFNIMLPCSISTLQRGTTADWGGRLVDIKFSILVRACLTSKLPQTLEAGQTLTYADAEYRIVNVRTPAPGAHVQLDVIDPNR